ncbi:hypothetical protein Tco_0175132 [Tanacetum coccineum]
MFRDTLQLPVETPANPFVAPANIHTIEAFMNRVGYQGVVDKLFHAVINQTHVDYATLLWWDFMNNIFQKKEAIQYPRFAKLIIADLMKKFSNIPMRIDEAYHYIKDDVPLVSVYITGNVSVQGMLIPDAFLTVEIRETDDFKEYETMFMKVAILMNQSQPVFSTKGMNRNTPKAHRSPTVSASPLEKKKRKQTAGVSSSPRKIIKQKKQSTPSIPTLGDDRERDAIAEASLLSLTLHKTALIAEAQENIVMRWVELTDIVSNPDTSTSKHSQVKKRISRIYSHLPRALRRMCRRQCYMIQDMERKCVTIAKLWETHNKIDDILHEMKRNLQDRADDIALWEALRHEFEKSSISNTSCREDDFHSHHDEHQDDDAPPKGEKRVKRSKMSKRSKSARDSLSKHSRKDSTTYVSKQQSHHQEWDAWEEENVVDEDEVVSKDIDKMVKGSTDDESYASKFSDSILNNEGVMVDDTESKIEPGSQKENLEEVEDYTNVELERTDEVVKETKVANMSGSQETRNEQTQTPISSPIRSPRKVSFSDKTISEDLKYNLSPATATTSKTSFTTKHKKISFTLKTRNPPGCIAGMGRRRNLTRSHIKNKFITREFFVKKIQEVLQHYDTIIPELTVSKTNEMLKKEMPCLVQLAVNKDREVSPVDISGMVSKEFAAHGPKLIEELFRKHMQNTTLNLYPKTSSSTATTSSADLQQQLYLNMKTKPQDQAVDPEIWEIWKAKFEKP